VSASTDISRDDHHEEDGHLGEQHVDVHCFSFNPF
jgi:hypothetical protein